MATTKIFAALCLFLTIQVSTAIERSFNGKYYEEPFDEISCANCTIQWDSLKHEYLDCDGMPACPPDYAQKIVNTHDDTARFLNHTWLSVRKNVPDGSYFIIIPETDWEKDYDVGEGTGAEDILGCFLCMAVYVDYNGEKSTYNYCTVDDCSKYPKYTGSFAWEPITKILGSQKQICTDFTIPGTDPITTHGHCFLDWSISPLGLKLPEEPKPTCPPTSPASRIIPTHFVTSVLAGFIFFMFL
ncbi:uncharacterized protein LOC144436156 [Glandiceps talaboti]